jgi:hypothetical protein
MRYQIRTPLLTPRSNRSKEDGEGDARFRIRVERKKKAGKRIRGDGELICDAAGRPRASKLGRPCPNCLPNCSHAARRRGRLLRRGPGRTE